MRRTVIVKKGTILTVVKLCLPNESGLLKCSISECRDTKGLNILRTTDDAGLVKILYFCNRCVRKYAKKVAA